MAKKRKKKRSKARAAATEDPQPGTPPGPDATPEVTPPSALADRAAPGPADDLPPVPVRARQNLFIAAFLALSVVAPASYYLGGGGMDERFAWRMFSTVRQYRCQVVVRETRESGARERLELRGKLHVAWTRMLERGRPAVIHEFLRARCDAEDNGAVRLRLMCRTPDRTQLPPQDHVIACDSGVVTVTEYAGDAS